ncbi:MAG: type II secretion system protein [Bdellovibrionota bacterium]
MDAQTMCSKNAGFTLIELLVAVALIGILSAIAIPSFYSYRLRAVDAATLSDARNIPPIVEAVLDESTADYLCGSVTECQVYAPKLAASPSTSAICWEVVNGELARFCACSHKGNVRAYCVDITDDETLHATSSCPCPSEP